MFFKNYTGNVYQLLKILIINNEKLILYKNPSDITFTKRFIPVKHKSTNKFYMIDAYNNKMSTIKQTSSYYYIESYETFFDTDCYNITK